MDQRTRTRLQGYGKPGGAWFREGLVVLQWRDCPLEVLDRASCEASELHAALAAQHPNLPERSRERLGHHTSALVRGLAVESSEPPASRLRGAFEQWVDQLDTLGVVGMAQALGALAQADALVVPGAFAVAEHAAAAVAPSTADDRLAELAAHPMSLVAVLVALRDALPDHVERLLLDRGSSDGLRHLHAVRARRTRDPRVLARLSESWFEEVRAEAARNPECPPEVLTSLVRDRARVVRLAVMTAPAAGRAQLLATAFPLDMEVAELLSQDPACPAEVLDAMVRQQLSRGSALRHQNTTAATLAEAARDADAETRWLAASHPNVSDATLEALAHDPSLAVRSVVAARPRCPQELLEAAATSGDPELASAAAWSAALTDAQRDRLAAHASLEVVSAVAEAPATQVVLLEQLARHAAEQVRRGVARNLSAPPALLGVLAEDRSPAVSEAALSSPACPPDVLERAARQRRLATARNPSTPAAALVAACEADSLFRDYAAANPAMPAERLEQLADTRDTASRTLRQSLVSNAALPAHLFQQLLVDCTDDELPVLLRNPALPDDVLRGYATGYHLSDEGDRDHAGDALRELRLRYARRQAPGHV